MRVILSRLLFCATFVVATPGFASQDVSEIILSDASGVRAVAAGARHSCAISNRGHVWCWGDNFYGQLGDGTTLRRLMPTRIADLSERFQAVSVGERHSCALSERGAVYCWGANSNGQLGNGTTTISARPVQVSGLGATVRAIALGNYFSCAIASNGRVRCWGANGFGQLGDGSTTQRTTPVTTIGLSPDVEKLAVGNEHACALERGGRALCWGRNTYGQLGDGTNTHRPVPTPVVDLRRNNREIAAGALHSCLVNNKGRAQCWGRNFYGQLGNGAVTDALRPVQVARLGSDVRALALGGSSSSTLQGSSCALNAQGRALCWGYNASGQLGTGNTSNTNTPARVLRIGSEARGLSVSRGGSHACFIVERGRLFCTGANGSGQLGSGSTNNSIAPGLVEGELHRR